ncbi:hypothetical protein BHM03_00048542 [Ensete ventricosum]|uniref:Uncharacterized protein n=1 Tax=Ensete ventricosum TaxID=4639 RepID=A0A445MLD8_ENSVE|nr:hypothetical protein BHM03_00048542 [Ensete ventricosum]
MSGGVSADGGREEEEDAGGEDARALPLTLHSPASIPRGRNGSLPKVMNLVPMPKVSVPRVGYVGKYRIESFNRIPNPIILLSTSQPRVPSFFSDKTNWLVVSAAQVIQLAKAKLGSEGLSTGQEDAEAEAQDPDNGAPILAKSGDFESYHATNCPRAILRLGVTREWVGEGELLKERTQSERGSTTQKQSVGQKGGRLGEVPQCRRGRPTDREERGTDSRQRIVGPWAGAMVPQRRDFRGVIDPLLSWRENVSRKRGRGGGQMQRQTPSTKTGQKGKGQGTS